MQLADPGGFFYADLSEDWEPIFILIHFWMRILLCGAVLRIRIHRIHMFLGLLDPDPLVRGMDPDPALDPDPDPSIIMQK